MRKNFVEKLKTQTGLCNLIVRRGGGRVYKLQMKSVPIHAREALGGAKGVALPVLSLGA